MDPYEGLEPFMSTWTIYYNPSDLPGHYVVRRFDIMQGETEPVPALQYHYAGVSLEGARESLPPGLTPIPRSPADDPAIVETWL